MENLKKKIARIDGGFAVLDLYGNIMMLGRFYVLKDNDFYRVGTAVEYSTDIDSKIKVSSIRKNGFEIVNSDEVIWSICEKISSFFSKDAI